MGQGEVQEQQRCGAGRGCRSKRGDVGQPPCTGGPGQHPQEGPLSHAQLQPPSGICGTLGTGTCGPPGPQRHANPPQAVPPPSPTCTRRGHDTLVAQGWQHPWSQSWGLRASGSNNRREKGRMKWGE